MFISPGRAGTSKCSTLPGFAGRTPPDRYSLTFYRGWAEKGNNEGGGERVGYITPSCLYSTLTYRFNGYFPGKPG